MRFDRYLWLSMVFVALSPAEGWSQSWIASTSPAAYSCTAPKNTNIIVTVTIALDPLTVTNSTVTVWGEQSGRHSVTCGYEQGTQTITIDPDADFFVGERVDVVLTRRILSDRAEPQPGYSFSFRIRSVGGSCLFDKRSEPAIGPQSIDMLAHDFNRDGVVDFELLDIYPTNNCIFLVGYPSGGWTMPGHVYLGWPPVSMAVGDIDNDFRSDFAIAKGNDELAIVKNPGWGYGEGARLPVGFSASRVECADLDNDGWQDLLVARKAANDLLVLMNSDSGSFNNPPSGLGPVSPANIVPADIDRDGDMDLLVAQTDAGSIKIYRNNGQGRFLDSLELTVAGNPTAVAAGDLDGDGVPDFVSIDSAARTLTVVQNRGTLGFSVAGPIPVGGWGPNNVLLADFDGDRDLDIATLNRGSASVSIFKNLGAMSFTRLLVIGLDYTPNDFCAVDWDFDGDLDIVAISESDNAWNFLTNRGAAPRISLKSWSMDFGGTTVDTVTTRRLWIYNVGGSTDLQIEVQHAPSPQFTCTPEFLSVAPNDSGSITVGFKPANCSSYADKLTLVHNDPLAAPLEVPLQGYGKAIRSANTGTQRVWQAGPVPVSIIFGEPMDPASITDTTLCIYGSRSGRHYIRNLALGADQKSATFDIDGALLAEETVTVTLTKGARTARGPVIVAPYSWSFRIRASQGIASFSPPVLIGSMSQPIRVLAGDLQNDGFVDLVLATPQVMKLCTGSASGWGSIVGLDSLGSDARPATGGSLADLAGAGGVGIVYGTWDDTGSKTEGRFWSWTTPIRHLSATSDMASGSATADFDGDGDLDVAFSFMWQHSVQSFWNSPPNTTPGLACGVNGAPITLGVADFDQDGLLDIVASAYGNGTVGFARNMGDGSFNVVAQPTVGPGALPLVVADFNNDGLFDVAVGAHDGYSISILFNKGEFQFERWWIGIPGNVRSIAAADFNGDGWTDLAATLENAGTVMAWTNDHGSDFVEVLNEHVGSAAYGVEAVDYRRDGCASLVVTYDSYVSMMENRLTLSVKEASGTPSKAFSLDQNYPNPFNPVTVIRYTVGGSAVTTAQGGGTGGARASKVRLLVYDLLGREVATLVNEAQAPGTYEVTFDAASLASGVYWYRLQAGDFVQTRELCVIR